MTTSALFAASAWIIAPPALIGALPAVEDAVFVNGLGVADPAALIDVGGVGVVVWLVGVGEPKEEVMFGFKPDGGGVSFTPVIKARSVCATRTASAFLR